MLRRLAPALLALAACAGRYATTPPVCAPPPAARAAAPLDDADEVPVGDAPVLGPRDALVTVVVFGDFECPYCARGRVTLHDLRATYPDDVRVVWRNLPLSRHPHARLAAEAAMEAHAQGGDALFWRFHDVLFAHARRLARADLERYAALAGMDVARLRAALDAHAHGPRVDADVALADRLGVDGAPAFFVNGTRISGARPLDEFEALARDVIVRARTIRPRRAVYAAMVRDPLPPPAREDPAGWARVHDLPPPPDAPARGPADAAVVLQVFSDFECPYCARMVPTLDALRERYGDRLRVVWRDRPLPGHPNARLAAEAAREARAQGGDEAFWRYHDLLFAHQREPGGLGRLALEVYAREVGLDLPRFRAALDAHAHAAAIEADLEALERAGLRIGTPTSFLNGHLLAGARPVEEFAARIDALLRAR